MKRGGPLKRSDKPMAQGGLPAPTKAQELVFRKLLEQVGCAVCLFHCRHDDGSRVEDSIGEIHHVLSGGNRISHSHVIPLCRIHHTDGKPGHPSRHSIMGQYGKAQFEEKFGTEAELAMLCEERINDFYFSNEPEITISEDLGLKNDVEMLFQDLENYEAERNQNNDTSGNANVEQIAGDDSDAEKACKGFTAQVNLHFVHFRYRKADPDGLSVKAAIDGLVKAGILRDDSAKEIETISHEQRQIKRSQEESTEITITEVVA